MIVSAYSKIAVTNEYRHRNTDRVFLSKVTFGDC